MKSEHTRTLPLNQVLVIVAVWSANILLMTSQTYFTLVREGRSPALWNVALPAVSYSVLWMILTPIVLWLGKKFPFEQHVRARNLTIHLIAGFCFAILHTAVSNGVSWYVSLKPGAAFPFDRLFTTMIGYFDYGLLVYWIILLIQQALLYYRRVQERDLKASQLQTQLVQAQLQALKMQLHPHFLFNTLHSISALVHEDVDAADRMIARLGDFLRIRLNNSGEQMVTLKSEMESLQSYFEIERVRFRDELELQLDIEPKTLDAQFPSFLWQPVLENAIRHGIATSEKGGRITVRARETKGNLVLEVEDNGSGFPTNQQHEFQVKEGIGLANTRAILQHIYGSHHRFDVTQLPRGGVIATLEIPFATMIPAEPTMEGENHDGSQLPSSSGRR